MSKREPRLVRHGLIVALLAAWCALGILVDLSGASYGEIHKLYGDVQGAAYIVAEVLCSLPARDDAVFTLLVAILLYQPLRTLHGAEGERMRKAGGAAAWVVGALFAAALLFGRSFDEVGSSDYVMGGIAAGVRSFMFFSSWLILGRYGVCQLFCWLDGVRAEAGAARMAPAARGRISAARLPAIASRLCSWFDRHPFAAPAIVLAVAWLPVLIGYAPALFMWDTDTQILQWFGLPNHISSSVRLLDSSVLLTQHHPPFHTALVGLCVRAGMTFAGSENVGIFLYAFLQWAFDIAALAWAINLLSSMGTVRAVRLAVLAFLALVPAFSNYSVLVTKDVPFAAAVLVFAMELVFLVRAGGSPVPARHVVILSVSSVATALLRSGAVAVVIAACVAALAVSRRHPTARRCIAASLACSVGVSLILTSAVYPALAITSSSKREVLSIPEQQVARFMRDHPGWVTSDELRVVDAVLDASKIARVYEPSRSDPVKGTFREDANADDLRRFFELWVRWFAEDPGCFLSATAANYYGYFYAGSAMSWSYTSYSSGVAMANAETDWFKSGIARYFSFEPAQNPVSRALDGLCSGYRLLFQRLPLLTLTMQAALYDWALLLITVYAITRHQIRLAPLLVAAWVVLAVALAGPCNATTYFRYAYPIAVIVPFAFALAIGRGEGLRTRGSGSDGAH